MRLAALSIAALAALAAAPAPANVTLSIDGAAGNVGETVEVDVLLTLTPGTLPAAIQLFVAFDGARLEPATGFYLGGESPVLPGPGVAAAGKTIEWEVYEEESAIGFLVFGLNENAIPAGLLLTMAFNVVAGAPGVSTAVLDGIAPNEPIELRGELRASNASANPPLALPVFVNDGSVTIGCTPRAAAPGGLAASQDRSDGVLVTWSPVADPGAQYRVYRNGSNDAAGAVPIGAGWQTATNFVDTTAEAPGAGAGGCACNRDPEPVVYFYWVQARTADGCAGDLSALPVQGARAAAKFSPAADAAAPKTFPENGMLGAAEAIAVRIAAEDAADAWLAVEGAGGALYTVHAVHAGGGDVWIEAVPAATWPEGAVLDAVAGNAAGPIAVHSFTVNAAAPKANPQPAPLDPASVPYLDAGLNAPYALPAGVYDAPAAFALPVPDGERAAGLVLYYLDRAAGAAVWRPADAVDGWLVEGPAALQRGNAPYLEFTVRHGGIVQLGYPPAPRTQPASVLPLPPGDAAIAALLGLALLAAARRTRRA